MAIRNGAIYFAYSRLLAFPAGADELTPDCIGLYVEVGGYIKFTTYGGDTDEFLVGDKSYVPGMFAKVFAAPAGDPPAQNIHALK